MVQSTYMSWWPADDSKKQIKFVKGGIKGKDKPPKGQLNVQADIKAEGDRQPIVVLLQGLDEQKMIQEWDRIKSGIRGYNLISHNCSTTIATLLIAGAGFGPSFVPSIRVADYAASTLGSLAACMDKLNFSLQMWSPEHVQRFAYEIMAKKAAA